MSNYTEISLTYTIGGEYLIQSGDYKEAEVEVLNGFTKNEKYSVLKPSITNKLPIYSNATKNVTLGLPFIIGALERPVKPRHNATQSEYDLFSKWTRLSTKQKLTIAVEQYVKDMGGSNPVFEIL